MKDPLLGASLKADLFVILDEKFYGPVVSPFGFF